MAKIEARARAMSETRKCPRCGETMEKSTGVTKNGYFQKGATFEFWSCPKCGFDTRTKEEVF